MPPVATDNNVRDAGHVLRRLLPYLRPYSREFIGIFIMLVLGSATEVAGPYFIGVAVDQFIDPAGAAMPPWLAMLLPANASRLLGLSAVMIVLALSYIVSWASTVYLFRGMVRVSQQVLLTMRSQILQQIQRLSLKFFDEHEAGDLMSRLINDTQVINDMFGAGITRVLRVLLVLVGIVVSMFLLNWRLTLTAFSVFPFLIVITVIFSQRARRAFRRTRETIGHVSAELQENIAGVREVQAFHRENETLDEFQSINERNRSANVEAETLTAGFIPLLDVFSTVAVALVIGVGGYMVLRTNPPMATIGLIVAFITYVRRFYQPIGELAQLYAQVQAASAGAERIFELLDTAPDIVDAPNAVELPSIRGKVRYEHVCFAYVNGETVLDDVSAEIEPGQMVAIVGPTGSGKTTMVNLINRFYDVQEGHVTVDGYDVRDVTMASLRKQIGVVAQDTFLFAGTVMDNIRYGRLEATDEEVVAAAKTANAHTFIERLPEGYQTVIGERGATLSQGNRQLLSIARAVLKDPRILILDEATSSVDTRTEILIQRALSGLFQGRTSLVIAHRLSTIRNADQILVIQDGRIVERGTHRSLLDAQGAYYALYMSQFRRQEDLPSATLSAGVVAGS
ncbi:MAG: ABC transporter ATP-binding protein [Anaerolineae bacterium]